MSETKTNSRHERSVARKRQQRQRRVAKIVVPLLGIIVLGAGVGLWLTRDEGSSAIEGLQKFDITAATHVQADVKYEQTPPAGGDHFSVWQNCGAYNTPITEEQGVHSLEHGAVWITYKTDLPRDQINELRSLSRKKDYVLVSPVDNLPSPVVASAWKNQVQLPSAADPRLDEFIKQFVMGSDAPEPGAACTGGEGRPT
jgi:hypothetical protein